MWLNLVGRGVVGIFIGMGIFVLGAFFPCFVEFDKVMYGGEFNKICVYVCVNCVF